MEKESVLVQDNKGVFLKMFKRTFKDEFDFFVNSFSKKVASANFDRFIYVVYDKTELIEYLSMDTKGSNVLVCLFNKQLYGSLLFLEEVNNLILLDESKTKPEIIKDLKVYFNRKSDATERTKQTAFTNSTIFQTQFHDFHKAMFFLS
ncbi:hypothetical protein [Flavobacterium aquidurense]|jgi:hypothetical protein|uniref:hypothetical protein n=1 Tax=Flavobacterium aquidurense TaxID=362413 RepID=UPI00285B630F|nr:hypothetical protein [Flavobacterium aquidurense]MDR7370092.1 hypothetical protein [Flavobacterium aquidurense]